MIYTPQIQPNSYAPITYTHYVCMRPDPCAGCVQWKEITTTTAVKVSDKHDGVINRYSARWSDDDDLNDRNNKYFDDLGVDGGYNHFELRNAKRQYTYKPNDGGFHEGDPSEPMEQASLWLNRTLNQ